jgi:cob(I)alamin adenosyltransferase
MARIYTREGDDGSTSLIGGGRAPKSGSRFDLLGDLDEANTLIGLARADVVDSGADVVLAFLQQRLLNVGALVAGADGVGIDADDVTALEDAIDRLSAKTGGFQGFVLPGGDEASARLQVARAVVRRAERAAVRVSSATPLPAPVLAFLNRAGDLLYAAARYVASGNERHWDPEAPRP